MGNGIDGSLRTAGLQGSRSNRSARLFCSLLVRMHSRKRTMALQGGEWRAACVRVVEVRARKGERGAAERRGG